MTVHSCRRVTLADCRGLAEGSGSPLEAGMTRKTSWRRGHCVEFARSLDWRQVRARCLGEGKAQVWPRGAEAVLTGPPSRQEAQQGHLSLSFLLF